MKRSAIAAVIERDLLRDDECRHLTLRDAFHAATA